MRRNVNSQGVGQPAQVENEDSEAGVLVLLGFTRGDVQMAVCSASERRKPSEDTDQNAVVFLRGIRQADGKPVADCPHCKDEHRVEEDFFQAIADAMIDVTQACDNSSSTFELSDVFQVRLDELRNTMPAAFPLRRTS